MKNTNTTFFLGLFLTALVVVNVLLWMYVATRPALSFVEAKQTYLTYFPDFLQHPTLLTLLNVALCAVSLYLLLGAGELLNRLYSFVRIPAIVVNTVLMAWSVFSLM